MQCLSPFCCYKLCSLRKHVLLLVSQYTYELQFVANAQAWSALVCFILCNPLGDCLSLAAWGSGPAKSLADVLCGGWPVASFGQGVVVVHLVDTAM
jgi:hypothetical protein